MCVCVCVCVCACVCACVCKKYTCVTSWYASSYQIPWYRFSENPGSRDFLPSSLRFGHLSAAAEGPSAYARCGEGAGEASVCRARPPQVSGASLPTNQHRMQHTEKQPRAGLHAHAHAHRDGRRGHNGRKTSC